LSISIYLLISHRLAFAQIEDRAPQLADRRLKLVDARLQSADRLVVHTHLKMLFVYAIVDGRQVVLLHEESDVPFLPLLHLKRCCGRQAKLMPKWLCA
jgi:hypothetical protein